MSRPRHALIVIWFGLLGLLPQFGHDQICPLRSVAAQTLKGSRPNIILVMTDDQGMGDLSCLGNPVLKTPQLDKLFEVSTRLRDFHVSPTCAPTRSAMMSGRHEFKNGVTHTILERERMALSTVTFPQRLQEAGYTTGIFGKWHLGDEDEYQPHRRGFDEVFIHGAGGIGQAYNCSCADAPPNQQNKYFDCVIRHNTRFVQTTGFCTDVFFDAALGWIKQQSQANKPFFAYVATNAPHGPMIAPQQYKQPFLDMGYDQNTAARYGMIVNIDDNLGRLMRKLAEWNLEENTLLIFMTDNGQASRGGRLNGKRVELFAGGLKNGKGSVNEGGTRVPAFWRWKGKLAEGRDIDALTAHIDLYRTFAALCNAEVPEDQVEGRNLLPLLEGTSAAWPDRYLFVHRGRWAKGANPDDSQYTHCAVRSERFRLINHRELYDIDTDPEESTDVAEQYPEVVAKMQKAYDTWWKETRPLMVNESVPNAPVRPFWLHYEQQRTKEGIPRWKPLDL